MALATSLYKPRLLQFLRNYVPEIYPKIRDNGSKLSVKILNSAIRLNLDTMILRVEGPLSLLAITIAKRLDVTFGHWVSHTLVAYIKTKKGLPVHTRNIKSYPIDVYSIIISYLFYFSDINLSPFFDDRSILIFLKNNKYTSELSLIKNPDTILISIKNNDGKLIIKEVELMQGSERRDNLEDPKKAKKELESLSEEILTNDSTSKGVVPIYGDAEEALDIKDNGQ